jgi:hypothetical protein
MFEIGDQTFRSRLRAGTAQKVKLLARDNKIARAAFHKSFAPHKSSCSLPARARSAFDIAIR